MSENKSIHMSLADIAKVKFPLVYEASLDVQDAGLLPVNEVLRAIVNKYSLVGSDYKTTIMIMADIENQLEELYRTYEDEPPRGIQGE